MKQFDFQHLLSKLRWVVSVGRQRDTSQIPVVGRRTRYDFFYEFFGDAVKDTSLDIRICAEWIIL